MDPTGGVQTAVRTGVKVPSAALKSYPNAMGRIDNSESSFHVLGERTVKEDQQKKEEEDELDRVAKSSVSLEAKDYLALAIASLETLFLPLLILVIVLLAILLLLR